MPPGSASGAPHGGADSRRPAVVEHADSPRSASDGRAANLIWRRPAGAVGRLRDVIRGHGLPAHVTTFAAIGIVSTGFWAVLYLALRGLLTPMAANGLALIVTAIGNTAANRRLTFGIRGRSGLARDQGAGLLAFATALGITTAAAAALPHAVPHASRFVELAVLSVANAVATAVRFLVLRASIGRRARATG